MHCILLLLATITGSPLIDSANAPRSLQAHAFESVVHIREQGTGTGFAVLCRPLTGGKYDVVIATAHHCVDGGVPIEVFTVRLSNAPQYPAKYPAAVIGTDEAADIALLRIICDRPIPTLRLSIGTSHTAAPDRSPGLTIGCSKGEYPSIWDVNIVGRKSINSLTGDPWVTDRASIPGRSGGPLICADFANPDFGRVMGLCVLNHNGESYFTDSERIRRCLRANGFPIETPSTPGHMLLPNGFTLAALRVLIVAILSSLIRL